MKKYEKPELNVVKFTTEDVMSVSNVDVAQPMVTLPPGSTVINPSGGSYEW